MRMKIVGLLFCGVLLCIANPLLAKKPDIVDASKVFVVDATGKTVAGVLDYMYPQADSIVHIAMVAHRETPYILGITRFGFASSANMHAMYASEDCTGSPYVMAQLFETIRDNDMLVALPGTIAPRDVISDPANETLWVIAGAAPTLQRSIQSSWDTTPKDEAGNILPPQCVQAIQDTIGVKLLSESVNLSTFFQPPYSVSIR